MTASLYKDSTTPAFHSMKASKFFRWLTGETQGDLGTAGPGGGGVTVKVIEAWDAGSNGGARSVSSDGTMDGLSGSIAWKTDASAIEDGWIVMEFNGTGINGNTGWQYFFQYGNALRDMDYSNVVIPRKDWQTDGGNPGSALTAQVAIAGETASGLCTQPSAISTATYNNTGATWYGWADNGMVMIMADDTANFGDAWFSYAGEVDDPNTGDNYPFVASSGAQFGNCHYVLGGLSSFNQWSRISPVDETTLLTGGRSLAFCQISISEPFGTGASSPYADFGGYYRSPISVAFADSAHQHVAGVLRYINITHEDTGARWTSDSLTRIGWAITMSNSGFKTCGWSMDWDGVTPHP